MSLSIVIIIATLLVFGSVIALVLACIVRWVVVNEHNDY